MSPAQSTGDAEAFWPMGQWTDASADESVTELLSRELSLSSATARILASRGFTESAETKEFLEPRLSRCMYPDRLPGIAQAATIIGTHVGLGHRIVVFGDFDADGMTASTILRSALVAIGAQADIFIPDRIKEGYGFTEAALDRCFAEHPGIKLIVTVDCGISHAPACDKAVAAGVEVVVTDHHEVGLSVPKSASALVNPCLPDTPEPMKHLCGAGVAFKLAHELVRRYMTAEAGQAFMQSLIAIAAVGTVGDLVPLVGENRIIASRGLDILNRARPANSSGFARFANLRICGVPSTRARWRSCWCRASMRPVASAIPRWPSICWPRATWRRPSRWPVGSATSTSFAAKKNRRPSNRRKRTSAPAWNRIRPR